MYIYYLFVTKIAYRFLYILYTIQNSYNSKHYKLHYIQHCNLFHNLSMSQFYSNLLTHYLQIIKIPHRYSYITTHTQQNKCNNKHYKLHQSLIFYRFIMTHMSLNFAITSTFLLLIIITQLKMLRNAPYSHPHMHKYKHKLHTTHKLHLSIYYNSIQKQHILVKNTLTIIELTLIHTHVGPMCIICQTTTMFPYVLTLNYYHFKIR